MRTVFHAESLIDAHLVKNALEQAGIPAFVSGEYLVGGVGQLPARDFLTVSVPDSYEEAATPLVREAEAVLGQSRESGAPLMPDVGGIEPA